MKKTYNTKSSFIVFLLAVILPSVVVSIFSVMVGNVTKNLALYYIALALSQLTLLSIFLIYNKTQKINGVKECNIKFNLNYKQIIIIITCGLVALFSFSPLVNLLEGVLAKCGYKVGQTFDLNFGNFGIFSLAVVVLGFLPAICEELIFRGIILNGYKKYSTICVIALTALMFMLMHMNIEQTLYQFVLGAVLSGVVLATGSLVSSMILHFVNNVTILFINYMYEINNVDTSIKPYNFTAWNIIYPILIALVGIAVLFFLIKLLFKLSKLKEKEVKEEQSTKQESNAQLQDEEVCNNKNIDVNKDEYKNIVVTPQSFWIVLTIIVGVGLWLFNFILSI